MTEQNNCIICTDCVGTSVYSEKYGCQCKIYYHEKCWREYDMKFYKCPFCRRYKEFSEKIDYVNYFAFILTGFIFSIGFIGIQWIIVKNLVYNDTLIFELVSAMAYTTLFGSFIALLFISDTFHKSEIFMFFIGGFISFLLTR